MASGVNCHSALIKPCRQEIKCAPGPYIPGLKRRGFTARSVSSRSVPNRESEEAGIFRQALQNQKYKEIGVHWKLLILQSLAEDSGFLGFPIRNTPGTYRAGRKASAF